MKCIILRSAVWFICSRISMLTFKNHSFKYGCVLQWFVRAVIQLDGR